MTTENKQPQSLRTFLIIWFGQAVSLIGSQLVHFALIWWITVKTDSAVMLSLATIVHLIPAILIAPFAGAWVDRWNRRLIMIVADSLIMLSTLVLAALFYFDVVQIWHIFVILFIGSLGGVFHRPAMMASTSLLVPREQFARVSGMNETLQGALSIAAPPLGAFLVSTINIEWILSIDVITALAAIIPLFFIAIPQPEHAPDTKKTTMLQNLREGFQFVIHWKGFGVMILIFTIVHIFFTPAMSIMPILVTQHFQGGALELGWLESAAGIGIIAGGLIVSAWNLKKRRIPFAMFFLAMVGIGLLLIGFAPANWFWLGLIGFVVIGLTVSLLSGLRRAAYLEIIPKEKQGRVFSLISSGGSMMDPLGLVIAGALTDIYGAPLWYIISGFSILVMGFIGLGIPAISKVEEFKPQPVPEEVL